MVTIRVNQLSKLRWHYSLGHDDLVGLGDASPPQLGGTGSVRPILTGLRKGSIRNGGEFTNFEVARATDNASPSGCAIVASTLYIGALQGKALLRVALSGTSATKGTPLFSGRYGRIRTAVAASDGSLWFTTSNRDGRGNPQQGRRPHHAPAALETRQA